MEHDLTNYIHLLHLNPRTLSATPGNNEDTNRRSLPAQSLETSSKHGRQIDEVRAFDRDSCLSGILNYLKAHHHLCMYFPAVMFHFPTFTTGPRTCCHNLEDLRQRKRKQSRYDMKPNPKDDSKEPGIE